MVQIRSNRRVMPRPRPSSSSSSIWFYFSSWLMAAAVLLAYFGWIGLALYRALQLLPAVLPPPEHRVVYNPSSKLTRYICGNISLPPLARVAVTLANCSSSQHLLPSRIWPEPADATPVHLRFSGSATGADVPCDVPCWSGGQVTSQRTIDPLLLKGEAPWTFTFSMEGPAYYPHLQIQPQEWRQSHFYATTSYRSEVPLPYYSRADFDLWHQNMVPFATGEKAALFLAHNCDSRNQREHVVRNLSLSFRVDSLSSCLHNAEPPPQIGSNLSNKRFVLQQYLFYLAFENQCVDDYITEKL
jgi:Glycosyltransferase family 10 (fucosyltransferase) C-term